jgi:hypothetical protein
MSIFLHFLVTRYRYHFHNAVRLGVWTQQKKENQIHFPQVNMLAPLFFHMTGGKILGEAR